MKKTLKAVMLGVIMTFSMLVMGAGSLMASNASALTTPKAATAGFGFSVGDIFYYRTIINDDYENASVWQYNVTTVSESFVEFDMYLASPENNYTFTYNTTMNNSYAPNDLVWHKELGLPTNITNLQSYNDLIDDLTMRYQTDFLMTPISVSLSNDTSAYHYIEIIGPNGYPSIVSVVNKTTGILICQLFEIDGDAEVRELMGWQSVNLVWDNSNSQDFGYFPGDELVVFEPAYHPNEGDYEENPETPASADDYATQGDDYGDDFEKDYWSKIKIGFLYYNPATDEQVIVGDIETYEDPMMNMLVDEQHLVELGRIIAGDFITSMGDDMVDKNLNCSMIESDIRSMMESPVGENLTNFNITTETKYVSMEGIDSEGNLVTMQIEFMDSYGFQEIFERIVYNTTGDGKIIQKDLSMTIQGPGVVTSNPNLGVAIGDSWQTVESKEEYHDEWSNDYNNNWENKEVIYKQITVTHIFAGNRTVMAAIGQVEMWTSLNATHQMINPFVALVIFDTLNPISFMSQGGWGELQGPPMLLPKIANLSIYESVIVDNFLSGQEGNNVVLGHFTNENSFRIQTKGEIIESDYTEYSENTIYIEINGDGIVTHLEDKSNRNKNGNDWGSWENHQAKMFVINSSLGCTSVNPSDITNIQSGDEFIWERTSFQPWDDYHDDPSEKTREKYVVSTVQPACEGSAVFLGQKYFKGANDTEYHANTWQLGETGDGINFWILGSVKDNDVWSWFESQFYDIGISDFNTVIDEIVEIMNFMMALPPEMAITQNNLNISGRTFELSVELPSGETQFMKFASNEEGIMQDMFKGRQYANGTWAEWDRTVLVNSDRGDVGEVFTEGIPVEYDPADTNTDTAPNDNPFNVPGYPLMILCMVSIAAIAMVARKIRK